ncbi:hypothetical protein [Variovorax sp. J22R115]|uniref:hypothetical protein n=1 Tax=Variovorax sp. J22R115 TaxID=3053509 RepID=UPI0025758600|nr:hypothetical protein [Variovorax sp. J22R115]MDM0048636.1 hypothetical protein [Variovorax sp. J22R115]
MLQPNFYNDGAYFPSHELVGNLDKLTPLVKSGVVKSDGKVSIASCRDRLFVGSSKEGTCDAPGNNQKFGPGKTAAPYNARVEVCSQTEGPVRSDLCLKYPNGNYKPMGTIQTYSDKMRFAAFGYLMDNTNNRYGGVLRAPMKFTGPTAQNERFEKIANEAAEWDARSGVFIVNPLPGEGNSSGVVNYLNQFGRTGSTPGTYKTLDPVGVYGNYDGETSQRRGWYFDLPDSESEGERQVSQMVLSDGYLFFNTLIPNPNTCGAGGGGHSCAVNAMTGLSSGSTCIPSTVGLLSSPLVIQAGDGAYSSTDSFGRRIESKKVSVINQGTGTGAGPGVSIDSPISGGIVSQIAGRLNWRQITNFKDVKQ